MAERRQEGRLKAGGETTKGQQRTARETTDGHLKDG